MTSSEKLGIMQPGPPGTHRMVLDFSNIILGFDAMHSAVERAEKMVASISVCIFLVICSVTIATGTGNEGQNGIS
jgi:hypothetical protein